MRILNATADFKWTGPAEPMLNAILGLRALGHQVDLACPEPPPELEGQLLPMAQSRGIDPVLRLVRRRGYRPLRDREEVRRLREQLEKGGYEVLHVHHTRDQLLGRLATWRSPTRLVLSWHHGDPVGSLPWTRLRLGPRLADGLVVLAPRLAEHARRELRWPESRVAVVPGSVDLERFRPRPRSSALRRELGLGEPHRVLMVVARLQPHRRFDLLLAAFERALRRAPELRLVVLGRGTRAREVLHEPVRERGLEGSVIHAGHRGEDYPELLALADALVFLVPGSDGSCRAVLEAMATGVPAIVSRRGVLPETVLDGETGRVVDEDLARLADALCDPARNPERWQRFGRAARERVLARHGLVHAAGLLEAFYRRLLGAEPLGPRGACTLSSGRKAD